MNEKEYRLKLLQISYYFQNTVCSSFLLFFIAELLYISMNLSTVDGLRKSHRFAFYMDIKLFKLGKCQLCSHIVSSLQSFP